MDDYLVDRVLLVVEQIPPGRVVSYGEIGRLAGTSARRVGTIMRLYSHDVPYWRVVGAAGDPGGQLLNHFRPHWDDEGIAVKPNGLGCRIADYRADLVKLAADYRRALDALLQRASTPLPELPEPAVESLNGIGVTVLERLLDHSGLELVSLPGVRRADFDALARAVRDEGWTWPHGDPGASPG